MRDKFTAQVRPHGLGLGDFGELVLVAQDEKAGLVVWLQTARWRLEVRITPGGQFRVDAPRRRYEH